ncbi:unnamed protein product [Phyllotreta striolata]|uniref:peptidyl-tRNA hydrolase n=1 Tax=Phyllotreta striolata TaxID=444603 RepID=A0A9N9TJ61_PHYSR|nr:unnamed protein product [Phyllotreta striolata]
MSEPFIPNQDFLHQLISMGINHDIATQALFCTGNKSLDEAVEYIFSSQESVSDEAQTLSNLETKFGKLESGEEEEDVGYFKMTFVVNSSLKMGVGKIAAQVGHACLGLFRELMTIRQEELDIWEQFGEKKIVLKGTDEAHLTELYERAKEKAIPCYLVRDAGHTQIPAGSVTVLSVFGLEEEVNTITGKLSLM